MNAATRDEILTIYRSESRKVLGESVHLAGSYLLGFFASASWATAAYRWDETGIDLWIPRIMAAFLAGATISWSLIGIDQYLTDRRILKGIKEGLDDDVRAGIVLAEDSDVDQDDAKHAGPPQPLGVTVALTDGTNVPCTVTFQETTSAGMRVWAAQPVNPVTVEDIRGVDAKVLPPRTQVVLKLDIPQEGQ